MSSDTDVSNEETTTESSEDSEEETLRIIRLLRTKKQRSKAKKARGRKRTVKKTPPSEYSRGECSRRPETTATRVKTVTEEPRTPLTGGYKGIAAGCSQGGFVDYTLQVLQQFSAKKVPQLREICEKEGIRSTRKDEMIMELVKRQTKRAYGDFFDTPQKQDEEKQNSQKTEAVDKTPLEVVKTAQEEKAGATEVVFIAGKQWTNGWRKISTVFGMTEVEVRGKMVLLKHAKSACQLGGKVKFVRFRKTTTTTERYKLELIRLLKHPKLTTSLSQQSTTKLVGFYRTANLFGRKEMREKLKLKIDRSLRKKMGVSVRRRVIVEYPYNASIQTTEVRRQTEAVVDGKLSDKALATFVKRKVRIVSTRNRTVGEVAHNHRSHTHTKAVRCPCEACDLPKRDGHVLTRMSEMTDAPRFLQNARNVTRPNAETYWKDIIQGICAATAHLKGGSRNGVNEAFADSCFKSESERCGAWTESEVRVWFSRYPDLVLAPVDRNPGDTAMICPVLYRHGFGSVFTWNRDYETVTEQEDEILAKCRRDFEEAGIVEIGKWKTDGRFGKAYVIPKDKDLQRWRPIAPTCNDPTVAAQRRGARALHCLIIRFSKTKNFHLKSTMELKSDLGKAEDMLRKEGCDRAMGRCYDIKEMFSSISHQSVRNAVSDLVMYFEEQGWRQVRVAIRGKLCQLSKTYRKEAGFISVKLDMIRTIVDYDLTHTYMTHGEVVRK
ncbi:hypothetical protein CBR_g27950 [Chara braunii]|uniref:Uncharacterized protein n=1 Tax=Chara braunii TaxID=69332 RepID=A0A388L8U8_CHABU|nr:hypothetical protein CBR_g27950 [Chara braunii]|eukprot:GBG78725.1 hypothetical protein CBR_g27950 [Chara braunii]